MNKKKSARDKPKYELPAHLRDPIPEPERQPLLRKWQDINGSDGSETSRMIVPGGWVYRCVEWNETNVSVSLCFVPYAEEKDLGYD